MKLGDLARLHGETFTLKDPLSRSRRGKQTAQKRTDKLNEFNCGKLGFYRFLKSFKLMVFEIVLICKIIIIYFGKALNLDMNVVLV